MKENQYKDMNFTERLQYFMEKKGINDNQMTVNAGLSVGLIGKAKVSGKGMSSMNIEKNSISLSGFICRLVTYWCRKHVER